MRSLLVSLILLLCFLPRIVIAAPLDDAVDAYKTKGVSVFIPTLLKGSPLEGDNTVSEKTGVIRRIEQYYGDFVGHEVIEECVLSERVKLVYYVLHYDRGPFYGVLTQYDGTAGTIVTRFNFQTDAATLWSDAATLPCRK